MSKAETSPEGTGNASTATSGLDDGYKRHFRYQKLGLVALLIIGLLSSVTFWQVNTEKDVAVSNQQVLSQSMDKDLCKVYPETESCKISAQIKAAPTEAVIPKDGQDGKDGQNGSDGKDGAKGADGRGVTSFDQSSGNLIVAYTDGETKDLGRIVGRDGKDGATGPTGAAGTDGRGIVSSSIEGGSLIVTYTDGAVQNAGFVVGPKGDKGDTGAAGADGAAGRDGVNGRDGAPGLTPTGINSDIYGTVTVTYNDGSAAVVGKIILPNIEIFTCENNVMTLKLTNGPAHTAPAVCQPQTLIPPAATNPIK
jgi:hypothetical protein